MKLTPSRRGAWIVNTAKHLGQYDQSHPGLSYLDNIAFAGKCGSLLITLSGDATEQLSHRRVKAHARACSIGGPELTTYLQTLKVHNCVDWDASGKSYEVLAFSRQRVLATTSDILSGLSLSGFERVLPDLLEFCLLRPRLSSEVKEYLSDMLTEEETEHLLELVSSFEILGVVETPDESEKLYFNGYQFGDTAKEIGKALLMLSEDLREELDFAIAKVASRPGMPLEDLGVAKRTEWVANRTRSPGSLRSRQPGWDSEVRYLRPAGPTFGRKPDSTPGGRRFPPLEDASLFLPVRAAEELLLERPHPRARCAHRPLAKQGRGRAVYRDRSRLHYLGGQRSNSDYSG